MVCVIFVEPIGLQVYSQFEMKQLCDTLYYI